MLTDVFLGISLFGAFCALMALWPLRWMATTLPVFFASWLTAELAPQLLVVHAAGVVFFVSQGVLDEPRGWAALALSAVTTALLGWAWLGSRGTAKVLAEAIEQAEPMPTTVRWTQLLFPFVMRSRDVTRVRHIPYGPAGRRNQLDIYKPKQGGTGLPVILWVHGGGWTIGNKEQQGKPLLLHMASQGWIGVAINYRLAPRTPFPGHLEDCKRAVAWIRANIAEHGGDPSFIAVAGGSAGGHLTALLALTHGDPAYQPGFEDADCSVQAAVPLYGVYDFTNDAATRQGRVFVRFLERTVMRIPFETEAYRRASPLHLVRPDAPPFLVIHGGNDSLAPVEIAREFVRRLKAVSRNKVIYAELPRTQHAFDVFRSVRTGYVVAAIEQVLSDVRTDPRSTPETRDPTSVP